MTRPTAVSAMFEPTDPPPSRSTYVSRALFDRLAEMPDASPIELGKGHAYITAGGRAYCTAIEVGAA